MMQKPKPHQIPLLKRAVGAILCLWALLSFVATFFVIFLPSMACYAIPGKKGQGIFIAISRIWMRTWLTLVGCRISVKGQHHFTEGQSFIVTCNHNALLDVPLSSPFIPGANKTIAKTSFAKIPLFGWYYRKGSVLLNRHSDASRRQSFEAMKQVLAQGMHMCIYPEGTRNKTEEPLKPFYDGAFKLAVDTKTAIIPAVIFNTGKALPIHVPVYFWPHKLGIHFLPAIAVDGLSVQECKQKVYEVMKDYYTKNA
jgi:1-acyl-sn-glycerol-3-phosphate acyltransferase